MKIMISGSINHYKGDVLKLLNGIQNFITSLRKGGHTILIGEGNILPAVVIGAVMDIDNGSTDAIKIWRVPYGKTWEGEKGRILNEMTDEANLVIFIGGNNEKGGCSETVRREYNLAVSKGVLVMPLHFTGYTALDLPHDSNLSSFSDAADRVNVSSLLLGYAVKCIERNY